MNTRTLSTVISIVLLFNAFTLTAATPVDSVVAPHLQVYIHQTDKDVMKFRLSVLNPESHPVSITIEKGDEVYFTQVSREDLWDNIVNLSSLEDGQYTILVNNGKERITRTIAIRTATRVDRQLILN